MWISRSSNSFVHRNGGPECPFSFRCSCRRRRRAQIVPIRSSENLRRTLSTVSRSNRFAVRIPPSKIGSTSVRQNRRSIPDGGTIPSNWAVALESACPPPASTRPLQSFATTNAVTTACKSAVRCFRNRRRRSQIMPTWSCGNACRTVSTASL